MAIFDLGADGKPTNCDAARIVAMTGLAAVAPDDPEPEFVDVNADNVAAVTLQENNHIALDRPRLGQGDRPFRGRQRSTSTGSTPTATW